MNAEFWKEGRVSIWIYVAVLTFGRLRLEGGDAWHA